jgi:phenylalanyl-tRNA synthetase alpha chain
MINQLEQIKQQATEELEKLNQTTELEAWRVRYLGKKSELTQVLRGLAALSIEEKKALGSAANNLRTTLEENFKHKEEQLKEAQMLVSAGKETLDITLPGRRPDGHPPGTSDH